MLRIMPVGLHWLGPEPRYDLCAHGGVEMTLDGEVFVACAETDLAVSTGALHLLRTIGSDHTSEAPLTEHLVPHCGHFMVLAEDTGRVVNVGCPAGVNWWVRHEGGAVVLTREDGVEHRTDRRAWALAVAGFADAVAAFYAGSPRREFSDEWDAAWYRALRAEWDLLRSAIPDAD